MKAGPSAIRAHIRALDDKLASVARRPHGFAALGRVPSSGAVEYSLSPAWDWVWLRRLG
ncbi:MAG TPA: hypothetical protein VN948_01690 [Terriglobales bacterium]|nr:hypothetical protein [Terriglobales bacterium]